MNQILWQIVKHFIVGQRMEMWHIILNNAPKATFQRTSILISTIKVHPLRERTHTFIMDV